MSKKKNIPDRELDITGLLSLKRYEMPDEQRAERNILNTMRAVRSTNNIPSLLIFPDKSFAWMFAQPRYGVAALFIVFIGLHLLDRPVPERAPALEIVPFSGEPVVELLATVETNALEAVEIPGITPPISLGGDSSTLSSFLK